MFLQATICQGRLRRLQYGNDSVSSAVAWNISFFPNSLGQYALLARYTLCLTYVTGEMLPPLVASSRKGEDTWRRNPGMKKLASRLCLREALQKQGTFLTNKGLQLNIIISS